MPPASGNTAGNRLHFSGAGCRKVFAPPCSGANRLIRYFGCARRITGVSCRKVFRGVKRGLFSKSPLFARKRGLFEKSPLLTPSKIFTRRTPNFQRTYPKRRVSLRKPHRRCRPMFAPTNQQGDMPNSGEKSPHPGGGERAQRRSWILFWIPPAKLWRGVVWNNSKGATAVCRGSFCVKSACRSDLCRYKCRKVKVSLRKG